MFWMAMQHKSGDWDSVDMDISVILIFGTTWDSHHSWYIESLY